MDKPTTRRCHGRIWKRTHLFEKESSYWNIPFTSFLNHFNGKTKSRKKGRQGVLTWVEDGVIVSWVSNMQKASLFVTLQQLKLKVVTQIRPMHLWNGIPRGN
jgi:hypothetical protein